MLPALYIMNQSKKKRQCTKNLTSRKNYNINIIFYLRSSAAPKLLPTHKIRLLT